MENKKNYVDGVDVSGCNMKCDNGDCALYYAELNNDNNELIYGFNCSDNQDCYYKQLQRAKAENEKLKNQYSFSTILKIDELKQENERLSDSAYRQADYDYRLDDAEEKIEMLEQENEQLKKSIDRIMQNKEIKTIDLDIAKENERLKARLRPLEDSYFKGLSSIEIAELAKKSIRITAENRKLEYALQEIREYCEEQNLKADYTACEVIRRIEEVIGAE